MRFKAEKLRSTDAVVVGMVEINLSRNTSLNEWCKLASFKIFISLCDVFPQKVVVL